MDLGLQGKTAVVTGGGSNLGHGIVIAFARERANIVIADIDEPQAERTAALARDLGVQALSVPTDVTDAAQCERMVARALEMFGRIDVLVNNAGIGREAASYFREYALEDAHRTMNLNYWGAFYCCKAAIVPMLEAARGSIVNMSSRAFVDGREYASVYSSAKAGIVALSQCLAKEFGPKGIRVNSIAPGLILPESPEQVGQVSSKIRPRLGRGLDDQMVSTNFAARGQLGHPDDIARIVVFIASDAARFVTGKVLVADGGTMYGDEEERLAATRRVWGGTLPDIRE